MKIASWNVNSIRVRMPHICDWLSQQQADVLCLQETKVVDDQFPLEDIVALGYHAAFVGQKTYNGVAILTKAEATDIDTTPPVLNDVQKRFIAVTVDSVRIINVYVPNGSEVGSDKYKFKLHWLKQLQQHLTEELKKYPKLTIVGDYNIAPEDIDVHDPEAWQGSVLVSPKERQVYQELLALGLIDSFRQFEQPEESYSWWDYRAAAFRRNNGLRIDHILCSPALMETCKSCSIDKQPRAWEKPSDHTPVVAVFK